MLKIASIAVFSTVSALTVLSFLGPCHSVCEFLSHLRPLLACLAALAAAVLLLLRQPKFAIGAGILFSINILPVLWLYLPAQHEPSGAGTHKVSILQMNIWGGKNHQFDRVLKTIRNANPDVIGISEVTPTWMQKLKQTLPDYPYQVAEPHYGGITIFSRLPIKDGEIRYFGAIRRPRVVAHVQVGDRLVTLLFVHPIIPMRRYETRTGEFAEISSEVKAAKEPVIVAGDLNCTPWSYLFSRLTNEGLLRDTEQGYGPQPSWNAFWPCPIFPIDHCLASAEFTTISRNTLARIGSDHMPILTELAINASTTHR